MEQSPAQLLKSILNTAEKHPNTKVSKLIKCFEVERTPQNIALLLIELAEHPEFSADITISLKYYLDCFEELSQESSFAEAGIVLYNSSKIYAKRVDQIHHEIERLILSLSNVESTEENVSNPDAALQNTVKVKRGRKRALEQINGAIEAEMSAKRFKMLSNNKRFEGVNSKRNNSMKTHVPESDKSMKSYIPQSTWQHSAIEDFDYEDEVDSKKNYKLFTYHLEHRYNTLIPDINFKMYFKIKDFINGDCNDSALPESWPPLSDAYIEQFLDLEDAILLKEGHLGKARERMDKSRLKDHCVNNSGTNNDESCNDTNTIADSGIEFDLSSSVEITSSQTQPMSESVSTQENMPENENTQLMDSQTSLCDSGIGLETSVQSQTTDESQLNLSESNQLIEDSLNISKSSLGSDVNSLPPEMNDNIEKESTNHQQNQTTEEAIKVTEKDPTLLDTSQSHEEDLSTLKIILPHLPDEGIYFSDLDEKDRQMLSPAVVTQDVFRCVKDKNNIVIKLDDAIEQLFKIREPSEEIISLPLYERQHFTLRLNILKFPLKYFNKQKRFKLGPEFDQLKKNRLKKYIKRSSVITCSASRKLQRTLKGMIREHISPPSTPSYEPDWLGFPEESLIDKNRTLSRDSGISLHQTDRENIDDFADSPELLNSTAKPIALEEDSPQLQENSIPAPSVPEENPASIEKPPENNNEANNPSAGDLVVATNDKANSIVLKDNESSQLDELNEENRVRTKIHEWHNHLQPILACSRERHHFDVFALGTEIMTQFDRNDVCSEKVSFKNVMEKKDESLISRYFLSMLLLANQGNIIIDVQNKSSNGPSEPHDIRLKLLSRKRNIVSLEDNIGLRIPPVSTTQIDEQPVDAIVRTLKSVPEVPKMDDRDSGVAMSESSIV